MTMKDKGFLKRFLFAVVLMSLTGTVLATDGYFSLAYGTKSKGMGGAGVALYQNSLFGVSNPAGLVRLGTSYGVSAGLFMPNRSYEVTGERSIPSTFPPAFGLEPGKVTSDSKMFLMPAIAANYQLTEKDAIGLSIYGNGGMNTNYPVKTYYSTYLDNPVMPDGSNPMAGVSSPTGVNLMQLFGALQYSRALGDHWSIGVGGIVAWQSFEAKGLQAFGNFGMSSDPTSLTNNGASTAFGFGGKVGLLGEIISGLSVGATFQTPIYMSEFDEYKGLFAEAGKFNVPANWTAGVAWKPTSKITLAFDVKQIYYSQVKSIGNVMNINALLPMYMDGNGAFQNNPAYVPLGSDEGSGFGWEDMTIFKIGAEYQMAEKSTVRLGFSHGNNPVPESEVMFNILAPGVVENHLTIGFTQLIGKSALDFAVVHAFKNSITGVNPLDGAQTIELTMSQWEFEIGFRF